jgi:hypothetical protein
MASSGLPTSVYFYCFPGTQKCKKPDGFYTCVTWKFFYPNCTNANLNCNATAGAWLPQITVCTQQLYA